MPAPLSRILKNQLALWVAAGGKIAPWCREHGVAVATAYEWYRADWFKRLVEAHRRPMVDRAIGKMTRGFETAVGELDRLIKQGQNDSVRLAAARTLIDKMIDIQSHAELKAEIRQLEERIESIRSVESARPESFRP